MSINFKILNIYTNKKLQIFLKSIGSKSSFSTKKETIDHINKILWVNNFPWRIEQQDIINQFKKNTHNIIIINGVFGNGKTTLLLGLLIIGLLEGIYKGKEILFTAFNLCIRDEIRKKIRNYGLNKYIKVRTFDSIIYEICRDTNYKNLSLPDFEGKRKHCFEVCDKIKRGIIKPIQNFSQYKYVFIDETQDLESQCYYIFKRLFFNSKFIFVGDVYQSIQKEPRESLLWFLRKKNIKNSYKKLMTETPRIPKKILSSMKRALTKYYPEYSEHINDWKSLNKTSTSDIIWKRFYSYKNLYEEMLIFCNTYPHNKSMILTFSSAITVKGNLGDIARVRSFLKKNNIQTNNNHKKINDDYLFLSTANSSKGLERDNVFIALTFPLEKAFINFSNDLVVNLITVALTRSKDKVFMYIPAYIDKFSDVLNIFDKCPKPNKEKIHNENKNLSEFTFGDYIENDWSVTLIIRQNIIKYKTKMKLKKYAKIYNKKKCSEKLNNLKLPIMNTDEERSFIGIFVENLITSTWLSNWPNIISIDYIENNPMYIHCIKQIKYMRNKYISLIYKNSYTNSNISKKFEIIYLYSTLSLLINHKLHINFSQIEVFNKLLPYWTEILPVIQEQKPPGHINIQSNLQMPYVTGIADVLVYEKIDKSTIESLKNKNDDLYNIHIYELKASISPDWLDHALTQVLLYNIMTGKISNKVNILNPFKNTVINYFVKNKNINNIRNKVINDMILWNTNCYLCKTLKLPKLFNLNNEFKYDDYIFCNKLIYKDDIIQFSILKFFSPTRIDKLFNIFLQTDSLKGVMELPKSVSKQCKESKLSKHKFNIKMRLNEMKYNNKKIIDISNYILFLKNNYDIELDNKSTLENSKKYLNYTHNDEKKFKFDFGNGFCDTIFVMCLFSRILNFT